MTDAENFPANRMINTARQAAAPDLNMPVDNSTKASRLDLWLQLYHQLKLAALARTPTPLLWSHEGMVVHYAKESNVAQYQYDDGPETLHLDETRLKDRRKLVVPRTARRVEELLDKAALVRAKGRKHIHGFILSLDNLATYEKICQNLPPCDEIEHLQEHGELWQFLNAIVDDQYPETKTSPIVTNTVTHTWGTDLSCMTHLGIQDVAPDAVSDLVINSGVETQQSIDELNIAHVDQTNQALLSDSAFGGSMGTQKTLNTTEEQATAAHVAPNLTAGSRASASSPQPQRPEKQKLYLHIKLPQSAPDNGQEVTTADGPTTIVPSDTQVKQVKRKRPPLIAAAPRNESEEKGEKRRKIAATPVVHEAEVAPEAVPEAGVVAPPLAPTTTASRAPKMIAGSKIWEEVEKCGFYRYLNDEIKKSATGFEDLKPSFKKAVPYVQQAAKDAGLNTERNAGAITSQWRHAKESTNPAIVNLKARMEAHRLWRSAGGSGSPPSDPKVGIKIPPEYAREGDNVWEQS